MHFLGSHRTRAKYHCDSPPHPYRVQTSQRIRLVPTLLQTFNYCVDKIMSVDACSDLLGAPQNNELTLLRAVRSFHSSQLTAHRLIYSLATWLASSWILVWYYLHKILQRHQQRRCFVATSNGPYLYKSTACLFVPDGVQKDIIKCAEIAVLHVNIY